MFSKKFKKISAMVLTVASLLTTGIVNVSAESTKLDEHLFNSWTDAYYRQYVNPDDSTDVWHTLSGNPFQFRDGNDLIWSSTISNMEKHSTMKYRVWLNKYIESRAICIGYNTAYVKPETEVNDNTPFIAYIPTLDTIKTATVAEGEPAIKKMIIESKINCGINACKVSFNFTTTKNDAEGNPVAGSAYNDLVQFKRDGKIYVGNAPVGNWEKNKTYTLSVVESIGGKTVDVYLDGKLAYPERKILSDESTLTGFAKTWWYADYTGDTETAMPTGLMYVDDFKVYSGDMPVAATANEEYVISSADNTITVPAAATVADVKANVTGGTLSVGKKEDAANIETGDILSVSDGNFKRNYSLVKLEQASKVNGITYICNGNTCINDTFTTGTLTATVNADIFSTDITIPLSLTIAQYKDGKLVSATPVSKTLTSTDKTITASANVTDADSTIKLLLWNSLSGMAPIEKKVLRNDRINVYLASDSLVCDYNEASYPQAGWGMYFGDEFTDDIKVINKAKGGATAKSFYNYQWPEFKNDIQAGDYVILSFMHNDRNFANQPFAEYTEYLQKYIDETKAKGANIIFFTGFNRGETTDTHVITVDGVTYDFPKTMKDLAAANNVPVLDLHTKILDYIAAADNIEDVKKEIYLYKLVERGIITEAQRKSHPNGTLKEFGEDLTHLSINGAKKVSNWMAELLGQTDVPLAGYLK